MSKPQLTERQVSLHEAQAGIAAKARAEKRGGDPKQISALLNAANTLPADSVEAETVIAGLAFHRQSLGVTLALEELRNASADAQRKVSDSLVLLRMAYCFHKPREAYEMLINDGLPELDTRAFEIFGAWGEVEIMLFGAHVKACQGRNPSLQPERRGATEKKSRPPMKARR